ncbi:DNase I-like protein [Phytophthora palmivora]|uniref:DNase I-like protein n=1 Tax=Phytophthora palmivora TaxID=4796 RepID=A0A2P4XB95_9STRA|nr:DNase I-like protein [Phytophthora palmivora]
MVNVYAPNVRQDRELFYGMLQTWPWQVREVILAGDFNYVIMPDISSVLDRLGGKRNARSESAALCDLQQQLKVEDACILAGHTEEFWEQMEPTEFFTYWGPEAASRLDRFYVPQKWTAEVKWVAVEKPQVPSDHQCVRLHLRSDTLPTPSQKRTRAAVYPIKAAQPERVQEELLKEMIEAGVGREVSTQTWD